MSVHINTKKENIAKTVIMPGDPLRVKYIAEKYLTNPVLVNKTRLSLIYTGLYKDKLVTIAASGMGLPSIGIYAYELFNDFDVERIIRLGSCGSYYDEIKLRDLILVENSISESTYALVQSKYKYNKIPSSATLNSIIEKTAEESKLNIIKGDIYCSDVFYEQENDYIDKRNKYNVLGVEMETFALFNNASVLKKRASCLLTVSDSFCYTEKLTSEQREKSLDKMITLALDSCLKL